MRWLDLKSVRTERPGPGVLRRMGAGGASPPSSRFVGPKQALRAILSQTQGPMTMAGRTDNVCSVNRTSGLHDDERAPGARVV